MPGARHFTDLVVWQLADQLREQVFALTERPRFAADLKLRSQTDDAVSSVCRNAAEGFGAHTHPEFARFLIMARRSLNEVQDCFQAALLKRYVTAADLAAPRRLLRRLYAALSRLLAYLDRTPNYRSPGGSQPKRRRPPMPRRERRASKPMKPRD